jgi:hypothetical protein
MARVAVIGEPLRIHGYGLPGAILCPATDQAQAVLAWRDLPDEVDVAVLTPSAARWLASEIARRPWVLPVLLAEPAQGQASAGGGALPGPGQLAEPGGLLGHEPLAEPGAAGACEPPVPPLPSGGGCEPLA